jgi:hypothetical protein
MRLSSKLVILIAGMLAGVTFVLSCGDDSPSHADAAMCDCPAAEPPIADRIMVVNNTSVVAANSRGGESAACPAGAVMLSGSCTTETINPLRDVTLEQSGFYANENGWHCEFKNNENTPVTIKVSARCLIPAQ